MTRGWSRHIFAPRRKASFRVRTVRPARPLGFSGLGPLRPPEPSRAGDVGSSANRPSRATPGVFGSGTLLAAQKILHVRRVRRTGLVGRDRVAGSLGRFPKGTSAEWGIVDALSPSRATRVVFGSGTFLAARNPGPPPYSCPGGRFSHENAGASFWI